MKHEKIIEKPDGSKVKLSIALWVNGYENICSYEVVLWHLPPRKKNWIHLDFDDYSYRRMNLQERKEYREKKLLEFVSEEELLNAKMELWELLKPLN